MAGFGGRTPHPSDLKKYRREFEILRQIAMSLESD